MYLHFHFFLDCPMTFSHYFVCYKKNEYIFAYITFIMYISTNKQ